MGPVPSNAARLEGYEILFALICFAIEHLFDRQQLEFQGLRRHMVESVDILRRLIVEDSAKISHNMVCRGESVTDNAVFRGVSVSTFCILSVKLNPKLNEKTYEYRNTILVHIVDTLTSCRSFESIFCKRGAR